MKKKLAERSGEQIYLTASISPVAIDYRVNIFRLFGKQILMLKGREERVKNSEQMKKKLYCNDDDVDDDDVMRN